MSSWQRSRCPAVKARKSVHSSRFPTCRSRACSTAADMMWLHMDPENYRALTVERGWSQTAYQRWLADTLTAALLPPRAP